MILRVYIAGKITGLDYHECLRKFQEAEDTLRSLSVQIVINPMKLGIPPKWNWAESSSLCLKVLREQANAIYLLRDWSESEGAFEEYRFALAAGYKVYNNESHAQIKKYAEHNGDWIDTSHIEFP